MEIFGQVQKHIMERLKEVGKRGHPVASYHYVVFELMTKKKIKQPTVARAINTLIRRGLIGKARVDHKRKIKLGGKVRTVKASVCNKWAVSQEVLYLK